MTHTYITKWKDCAFHFTNYFISYFVSHFFPKTTFILKRGFYYHYHNWYQMAQSQCIINYHWNILNWCAKTHSCLEQVSILLCYNARFTFSPINIVVLLSPPPPPTHTHTHTHTQHTMKLLGDILVSLRLSLITCLLCSTYSSGWILFIFIHLIKQL